MDLEVAVLENDFIRVGIAPRLGGRIVSLVDLSRDIDVMQGFAGGFGLTVDSQRPSHAFHLARAAVGERSVRMSVIGFAPGIDQQLGVELGDGATASLEYSFRNRSLRPIAWRPSPWVSVAAMASGGYSSIFYSKESKSGFAVLSERPMGSSEPALAPRWGVSNRLTLVPITGLINPIWASGLAVLSIGDGMLELLPRLVLSDVKLVLKTDRGQTMEAPANLDPLHTLRYTFDELGGEPLAFAILDAARRELFRWPSEAKAVAPPPVTSTSVREAPIDDPWLVERPATRYWAAHMQTCDAFIARDFRAAYDYAESALLYNGDDPIAWIEKAIAARHMSLGDDEASDLPNAHYLAPLEPLLRAEGFLGQAGLDGGTFFSPLTDAPQELVEVACFYIERQLFEDAGRVLDAAMIASDAPMLRYLYAFVCVASGKMQADAAALINSVKEVTGPLPFRDVEAKILRELVHAFPDIPILGSFSAIADMRSHETHPHLEG